MINDADKSESGAQETEHSHSHTVHSTHDDDAARRQLEAFRRQKDKFFTESDDSPILAEEREHFHGLNYYPIDLGYRIVATLVEEAHPGVFKVQTTTGDYKENPFGPDDGPKATAYIGSLLAKMTGGAMTAESPAEEAAEPMAPPMRRPIGPPPNPGVAPARPGGIQGVGPRSLA